MSKTTLPKSIKRLAFIGNVVLLGYVVVLFLYWFALISASPYREYASSTYDATYVNFVFALLIVVLISSFSGILGYIKLKSTRNLKLAGYLLIASNLIIFIIYGIYPLFRDLSYYLYAYYSLFLFSLALIFIISLSYYVSFYPYSIKKSLLLYSISTLLWMYSIYSLSVVGFTLPLIVVAIPILTIIFGALIKHNVLLFKHVMFLFVLINVAYFSIFAPLAVFLLPYNLFAGIGVLIHAHARTSS